MEGTKVVVSLIGIVDKDVITVSNRFVKALAQSKADKLIKICEKRFNKKYKDFTVFERESIYRKWKPDADDLLERFYIEI